jgi:hypothetical protein
MDSDESLLDNVAGKTTSPVFCNCADRSQLSPACAFHEVGFDCFRVLYGGIYGQIYFVFLTLSVFCSKQTFIIRKHFINVCTDTLQVPTVKWACLRLKIDFHVLDGFFISPK